MGVCTEIRCAHKAISMRKDAPTTISTWPWENTWLAALTRYAGDPAGAQDRRREVKDINVTLGGCAFCTRLSRSRSSRRGKMRCWRRLSVYGPQDGRGGSTTIST